MTGNRNTGYRAATLILAVLAAWMLPRWIQAAPLPATPLESARFARISLSAEMSAYMQELARLSPDVNYEIVGQSVQGRPVDALRFSRPSAPGDHTPRLKVMIVGSQHGGAEPAGGEALLVIARDLLEGDLRPLLDRMDVILLPNANPDGRDSGHRSNINVININTDFVQLSQPETRVLVKALRHFQPDVVLDSHESAVLKRKTLAKEGYLTDFYAQYESANHPAVPPELRDFAYEHLLPEMADRTSRKGLPAHRYIGEITRTRQPITNGGLTLRNFRNLSALHGALSFLVETKLDSREETFPTYRNIRERVGRQLICLRAFLDTVDAHQGEISGQVAKMRIDLQGSPVSLAARYVKDEQHPEIAIALRSIATRQLQALIFSDHRKVQISPPLEKPRYLAVTAHTERMADFLQRHQIRFERLAAPREQTVIVAQFRAPPDPAAPWQQIAAQTRQGMLPAGTLWIDLSQPLGRLAWALLDPRSSSHVFQQPPYAALLNDAPEFFIHAVP